MTGGNDEFHAALIHELKNNLGLLSMTLDAIADTGDATADAALDAARMQCQGVIERLQQALLVYKANQGRLLPSIDAHSPHDLVDGIARRTEGLARGRVRVVTEVAAGVPPIGFFDRDLVEMALINAIHNSLVYARTDIRIEAAMRDGCLAFSVRDDSEGYPAHILASLADGTPYRARGTGLGLQFARLIAEAHENRGRRGALRLANDGGAVFTLIVP
jgi:signal transduction histidine kinase